MLQLQMIKLPFNYNYLIQSCVRLYNFMYILLIYTFLRFVIDMESRDLATAMR
jgi:hypothetical protein